MSSKLRVGVAGPVGSGKTALVETLCLSLKKSYEIAVVTNDIYTKEDANFLIKKKVLFAMHYLKTIKNQRMNCGGV